MAENIYTALAKAQTSMGKALKDSSNPHFKSKYADLSSVMNACLPALTANGISVTHSTEWSETEQQLVTTFTHGASDTACSIAIPLLLGKRDMQGLGSAITYARRYGVMALAGIAPEDDDGNAAAAKRP
jgi:CTP synthase (UTP-ammonia lyase)